jgi:hypothetical protein
VIQAGWLAPTRIDGRTLRRAWRAGQANGGVNRKEQAMSDKRVHDGQHYSEAYKNGYRTNWNGEVVDSWGRPVKNFWGDTYRNDNGVCRPS